jgi:hypothetical protein
MAKPFSQWTVLPHGRLQQIDENVLTVTGVLRMPPMGEVERRMTVVRLGSGLLVVYSAIALDEDEMQALEDFGAPAFLIVPNDIHRMDAAIWKERYPALHVIAPAGARAKVGEVVHVDASEVDFGDPHVRFVTVPGTGAREAALVVDTLSGTTLILNDLIFDLRNRPGFMGWLFKKIGMTGDAPHMPKLIERRQVKNKEALSMQLERWADLPRLRRIVISHGEIIARDAAGVLRRVAHELTA